MMETGKDLKIIRKEKYSLQQKGSLTLECAIVFPLYFLGILMLIGMIDIFRIQSILLGTLNESAKELGMYAYAAEKGEGAAEGMVTDLSCMAYTSKKLKENLKGENTGRISTAQSKYENGIIKLKAVYFYKSPFTLIPLRPLRLTAGLSAKAWLGYSRTSSENNTEGSGGRIVYATEYESVYHTSENCTYLKLQIHAADRKKVEQMKNIYGERYRPCEFCMQKDSMGNTVYITEKGNRYHSRRDCGGLTRHLKLVREEDMKDREPCSRCGGGEK